MERTHVVAELGEMRVLSICLVSSLRKMHVHSLQIWYFIGFNQSPYRHVHFMMPSEHPHFGSPAMELPH